VLAILIEMKETSSTKADIHATLQEIKEELHKDMAKATETVCKLGERIRSGCNNRMRKSTTSWQKLRY
jgi:phage regulator Rha-like protein